MTLTVTTNHHRRPLLEAYELTSDEQKEFSYYDWDAIRRGELSAWFFRYRGELHDLSDFTMLAHGAPANLHEEPLATMGWQAARADSYFDGLVIRYEDDQYGDPAVIVGHYTE